MLAEQHDEWLIASRRYLSAESLKAVQAAVIEQKEVVPELSAAPGTWGEPVEGTGDSPVPLTVLGDRSGQSPPRRGTPISCPLGYKRGGAITPNLPVLLTGFVGRKRELADVQQRLLEETRVVCIAGPAGSGKTQLGLEIARTRAEGACFADLSVPTAPGLVVGAVASAAGLEAARVPDLTTLAHQLGPESGMLLLDNCEHLAGEPGRVADALIHAGPELWVLATSRELPEDLLRRLDQRCGLLSDRPVARHCTI